MSLWRLVLLLSLVLGACTSPEASGDKPTADGGRADAPEAPASIAFVSLDDYSAQREAAVTAIDRSLPIPRADNADDCVAVLFGEQACGGPTDFRVTTRQEEARVREQAARVTALDSVANAQFELVSTCALLSAPPLAIRDGVCVVDRSPPR